MERRLDRRKTKKKNNKLTIIILLILLLSISVGGIYGYWLDTVANPTAVTNPAQATELTIGKAKTVQTQLDVTGTLAHTGKKLVPADKANLSEGGTQANVEEFTATYTVFWKETGANGAIKAEDLVKGNLTVTGTGVIEGAEAHNGLVQLEITPTNTQITAEGDEVTVTVKVKLKEPSNKAAYDAIIGKSIKVNLTFSVAQ